MVFVFLGVYAGEAQSVLIAAIVPIFIAALAIAAFANGFWMSVQGYFNRYLPAFWRKSFHYMDYETYSFQLLVNNDLSGLVFTCGGEVGQGTCDCMYQSELQVQGECAFRGDDVLDVSLGFIPTLQRLPMLPAYHSSLGTWDRRYQLWTLDRHPYRHRICLPNPFLHNVKDSEALTCPSKPSCFALFPLFAKITGISDRAASKLRTVQSRGPKGSAWLEGQNGSSRHLLTQHPHAYCHLRVAEFILYLLVLLIYGNNARREFRWKSCRLYAITARRSGRMGWP